MCRPTRGSERSASKLPQAVFAEFISLGLEHRGPRGLARGWLWAAPRGPRGGAQVCQVATSAMEGPPQVTPLTHGALGLPLP